MKIFITGGTGFIGKHLVQRLARTQHTMVCLARRTSRIQDLRDLGAQIVFGDVTDRKSLIDGMQGCDWVLNLANIYSWWEPDRDIYRRVNIEGTRNVMECALEEGVSKVVHVSTVGVYGKPDESPIREETPVGTVRPSEYCRTKYEGDLIAWRLYHEKGLPLVVVYPCAVVGRGDTKLAGSMISRFMEHRLPARIFTSSIFTFVHVDDVAEVILRAAEKPDNLGEKYIAGNTRYSFDEVYALLSDVTGVPSPRLYLPNSLVVFSAGILTWLADRIKRPPLWDMSTDAVLTLRAGFNVDGSKVERELGIVYTPIRKAVEEECAWHRETRAPAWNGEERRVLERKEIDLLCEVKGVSHGKETSVEAHVVDLSGQGMYVASSEQLDVGTEMDAQLTVVQFGKTFWVKGKVLRSMEKGMAVRFEEQIPRDMENIIDSL